MDVAARILRGIAGLMSKRVSPCRSKHTNENVRKNRGRVRTRRRCLSRRI